MSANPANSLLALKDAFEQQAPACETLRSRRQQALERFLARGYPSTREEAWRYTNLRALARRQFTLPGTDAVLDEQQLAQLRIPGLEGHLLVFVNGRLQPGLGGGEMEAGLHISELETQDSPEEADEIPAFRDLNTAFSTDARLVEVDAGASPALPLYLLFVSHRENNPVMVNPRIEVSVGANARLRLVEHHVSLDADENLVNTVIDISLDRGANLTHTRIQDSGARSFQVCRALVEQAADSRYTSHHVCLGSALARMDIDVSLNEPGAQAELNGLMLGTGKQHMDTHTRVDHLAPQTHSSESYRCVLDGKSRGVFNGKVVVHPNAQKIEAHQSSKNLLLSEQAEIDTKPELEIYADDVKCSHGATVGQLDKNALFYLLSRGIDADMARGLLVFAFADQMVAAIDEPGIRHAMERRIVGQLPDGDRLQEFV